MVRWQKWLVLTLVGVGVVIGACLLVLQRWVGSDDFRARVQLQAQAALGMPVALGRLHVDPWPVLAVALDRVEIGTRPALTTARVELRLHLRALLTGRIAVDSLVVRGADLPQTGIDQLMIAVRGNNDSPSAARPPGGESGHPSQAMILIPRRLLLDDVTWRNSRGEATTIDADAVIGPQGLPDAVQLKVLAGAWQGARTKAVRRPGPATGNDLAWDIRVEHAGGTIEGALTVQEADRDGKQMSLRGQFETRNLELGALRRGAPGPLAGKLQASTTLSARAESLSGLAAALLTQSRFTVQHAVVNGIDLAKAVQTVGLNRGGQTRLDNLSGQVNTRGQAIQLSNLVASSGALSATGDVAVSATRALSGRVNVNLGAQLVGKAVGVPLVVGGTMDAPTVTLTRGAMLGAAVGTLVMPGIGTGAGASVGDAIGEKLKGLFGK